MHGMLLVGVWGALVAPLWIAGRRFELLLEYPAQPSRPGSATTRRRVAGDVRRDTDRTSATPVDRAVVDRAVRTSLRALWWLARLPLSPWRNTCLFRSVAECLIFRRYGVSSRVCLGVRINDISAVNAHAWVEIHGESTSAINVTQVADAKYVLFERLQDRPNGSAMGNRSCIEVGVVPKTPQ